MTILSVVNEVCDIVSLDRFTSVYGSGNPAAQTLLELAKLAGEEIVDRYDWKALERSAVAASSPLAIPSDYLRMADGGALRTAAGAFFRPVKNAAQWAVVQQVPSSQPYTYVSKTSIAFSPASAAVGAVLNYVSKFWIVASGGAEKATWGADDDGVVFPERLLTLNVVWRWRRKEGLNYDDQLAEFEAALSNATTEDRG